jgi:hypothetical protein
VQQAVLMLLPVIDGQKQVDAGVAVEVLGLQNDPALAEMQLQLLTAWADLLYKQHTTQQQQQLSPGTAGASSSSSTQQQQQQQQPTMQRHCADLLCIPAFHQDMVQLLPGGQAYLDAAAEEAAGWGMNGEAYAVQLQRFASGSCQTISYYLHRHLQSIAGQQQLSRNAVLFSGAAVRTVLELQLLASGAVQRQREQQRQQRQQQEQQQQACRAVVVHQAITDNFALHTSDMLRLQIKAQAAASRSCLPPELLHQAGLQLLQALAAPLQQWQLSKAGDSFLHNAAAAGVLPHFGDTLQGLVTAACGSQPSSSADEVGEVHWWICTVCFTATAVALVPVSLYVEDG